MSIYVKQHRHTNLYIELLCLKIGSLSLFVELKAGLVVSIGLRLSKWKGEGKATISTFSQRIRYYTMVLKSRALGVDDQGTLTSFSTFVSLPGSVKHPLYR